MDVPRRVGVMILPHVNLFPQAILPLFIFEPRYRQMLQDALETHRMFCVAMRRPGAARELPAAVAGLGLIRASVRNEDGTSNLILQGYGRVRLGRAVQLKPYRVHELEVLRPSTTDSPAIDALAARLRELVGERFKQGLPAPLQFLGQAAPAGLAGGEAPSESCSVGQILRSLAEITDPGVLADLVSCTLLPNAVARQHLLETVAIEERLRYLIRFLLGEIQRARKTAKS